MAKSVLAIYLIHENHAISQFVYVRPVLYFQNSMHLVGGIRNRDGNHYNLIMHSIRSNQNIHLSASSL